MARPRSRKGGRDDSEKPSRSDDSVALDGDEHAWWAQRDLDRAWSPPEPPEPEEGEDVPPPRDVLADHLGPEWRITFEFDPPETTPSGALPPESPEPPAPPEPIDTSDPYRVLGIDESATWEEIVECHRRLARANHPDQLFGRSEAEVAEAEERIRAVNIAYKDLRVRRGK